jgi:hypothetical protein|nr:MAG TPA: hypothetical protein [Caudoviricetes sp.]
MQTFKDFYQKELNESKNTDLADELRDCLTTIYQVAKMQEMKVLLLMVQFLKQLRLILKF